MKDSSNYVGNETDKDIGSHGEKYYGGKVNMVTLTTIEMIEEIEMVDDRTAKIEMVEESILAMVVEVIG